MTRKVTALPFADADPGHCRLCGVEILTTTGKIHKGRRWCESHQIEAKVIGQPKRARAAVFQRDRGICVDCGLDCTTYETPLLNVLGDPIWPKKNYRVQISRERALEWCEKALKVSNMVAIWDIDLGNWHVDHAMPLHLVDRSQPDAWKYWTLENLRTRCPECHKAKTAQEAKDRGKVRRLRGDNKAKRKRKIPQRANPWPKGRKLPSQGFSKPAGK